MNDVCRNFLDITGKYDNGQYDTNGDIINYLIIHEFAKRIEKLITQPDYILVLDGEPIIVKSTDKVEVVCYTEYGNIGLRIGNTTFIMFDPEYNNDRFYIPNSKIDEVKQKFKIYSEIKL